MLDVILWLVVIELIGLSAFPIAFHFFRAIPGHGYPFAKALGWLILGFAFWLFASLGLIQNTFGAVAALAVIMATIAWWLGRQKDSLQESPIHWLQSEWKFVIICEAVFLVSFLAFAYYRAFNPQIEATEKPMEFMFLNSILRSETFPPHDAWLSGFAVSYYYFGYVLVAMLTKLTGILPSIAFNLGLTTVFALSASGAFALGIALTEATQRNAERASRRAGYLVGILAIFLLLIIGNLEGAIESLHTSGIVSNEVARRLDINNLDTAPVTGSYIPTDNWWWWRASRVVNDRNPRDLSHVEVIDEFPFFSFLLGDLHPHVLAIPFTMLALGLAFEIMYGGAAHFSVEFNQQHVWRILLASLIIGSFGFLNSWDLPTYGFIVVAAFALAHLARSGSGLASWLWIARFTVVLAVLSVLLYLPFYLGFQSQARGVAPVVPFKTPLQQYLIMFGLFVFVLGSFVLKLISENLPVFKKYSSDAVALTFSLLAIPALTGVGILIVLGTNHDLQSQVATVLPINGSSSVAQQTAIYYFGVLLSRPWVSLLLVALIASIGTLIHSQVQPAEQFSETVPNMSVTFALMLALTGFLLTFGVEYLYIRDTFETRMNTVFKLYYQGWTLFAISSAFGAYYLFRRLAGVPRIAFASAFALLLAMSIVYPILAAPSRTDSFQWQNGMPTLDGMAYVQRFAPDEYAAIAWLATNARDDSVILEAPGPQYSDWNRFSMATGLPTILGWAGHELQWRGNSIESGKREPEIDLMFRSPDLNLTKSLFTKYNVRYVILTPRELQKYNLSSASIDKFKRVGKSVFAQGSVQIFQVQ